MTNSGRICGHAVSTMKTLLRFLGCALVLAALHTRAADNATELFKKGLLAEEVNRDFDTAIRAYQEAIAQLDEQRKLANGTWQVAV